MKKQFVFMTHRIDGKHNPCKSYEETIVLDTDMLFLSDPLPIGIYLIGTMFVLLKKLEHTKMKQLP